MRVRVTIIDCTVASTLISFMQSQFSSTPTNRFTPPQKRQNKKKKFSERVSSPKRDVWCVNTKVMVFAIDHA